MTNCVNKDGEDVTESLDAPVKDFAGAVNRLLDTMSLYADPGFYHGCAFDFDRPTGGFDEDFDQPGLFDTNDLYDRPMPGKYSRQALMAVAPFLVDENGEVKRVAPIEDIIREVFRIIDETSKDALKTFKYLGDDAPAFDYHLALRKHFNVEPLLEQPPAVPFGPTSAPS